MLVPSPGASGSAAQPGALALVHGAAGLPCSSMQILFHRLPVAPGAAKAKVSHKYFLAAVAGFTFWPVPGQNGEAGKIGQHIATVLPLHKPLRIATSL